MKTPTEIKEFVSRISPMLSMVQELTNENVKALEITNWQQLCELPEETKKEFISLLTEITELASELWLSLDKARREFSAAQSYMDFLKATGKVPDWNKLKSEDEIEGIETIQTTASALSEDETNKLIELLKARIGTNPKS